MTFYRRLLFIGIIATMVLLPIRNEKSLWVLSLGAGVWLWSVHRLATQRPPSLVNARVVGAVCALLISAALNGDLFGSALGRVVVTVGFVLSAHALGRLLGEFRAVTVLVGGIVAATLPLAVGLVQLAGADVVTLAGADFSVVPYIASVDRVTSTLIDPTYFGQLAASTIVAAIGVVWCPTSRPLVRGFAAAVQLAATVCLVATGSLSAFLGLAAGLACWVLLSAVADRHARAAPAGGRHQTWVKIASRMGMLLVVAIAGAYIAMPSATVGFASTASARISTRLGLGLSTGGERFQYFGGAWETFVGSPLWGGGYSDLGAANEFGVISSAHNSLLTILAAYGLVGLAGISSYYLWISRRAIESTLAQDGSGRLASIATLSAGVVLISSSMLYDTLFSNPWSIVVIGSVVACCYRHPRLPRGRSDELAAQADPVRGSRARLSVRS